MRATFLATALFAAAAALTPAAGQKPFTTADLYELRSVADVQLSPDGAKVAYTVHNADGPGRPSSEIWIADVDSRRSVRVSGGTDPRWSPDGKRIAFIGQANGQSGIFITTAGGAAPTFVAPTLGTNHPLPSSGEELAWAPDGSQIAFVSATPGPEREAGEDPQVITRYLYKPAASEGNGRANDNRRLHIFIADLRREAVRQLTHGDFYEHSIDWSPRGDEILFVSNREPDPDRVFNYDLFAARVDDGAIRRLTTTRSAEYVPRWSPDGSRIAYLGTKRNLTSSETTMEDTHVWTMNTDGSGTREVTAFDNRHGAPKWWNNVVVFTVQEGGNVRLQRQAAAPGPICDCGPLSAVPGSVGGWSVAASRVAYAFTTPQQPAELYIDGRPYSSLNEEVLRDRGLAGVESFTFKSHDGLEIEAFLTKPLALDGSRQYPLVAVIHGGPHGQQGPSFNARGQIYAGAGFASLMVNYRGSTGYGQKFADAIFGDQNGGEAKDVLGGVSAAVAKYPWIDRNALFIEGGSYGGQLTNWIVTQTDRFKAAVSSAGIANLVSFNYMSYYHDYLAVEFGSYPHEKGLMDKLWERSPIRHVKDVNTPTLLLHGENDNDVPIAESEQFYIALKDVGVSTVLVRYPREGHGLRETKHVADAIDRSLAWYRTHSGTGR
jgi:dipeptidyl aminopeptidase/acylaminoacyl peptidase